MSVSQKLIVKRLSNAKPGFRETIHAYSVVDAGTNRIVAGPFTTEGRARQERDQLRHKQKGSSMANEKRNEETTREETTTRESTKRQEGSGSQSGSQGSSSGSQGGGSSSGSQSGSQGGGQKSGE